MVELNRDRLLNLIKLLREGFEVRELILDYGYDDEEVFTATNILNLFKSNLNFYTNKNTLLFA